MVEPKVPEVPLAAVIAVRSKAELTWERDAKIEPGPAISDLLEAGRIAQRTSQNLYAERQFAQAKKSYEELLQVCQEIERLNTQRLEARKMEEETRQTIKDAQSASIKGDPTDAFDTVQQSMSSGDAYFQLGKYVEAAAAYRQARTQTSDAHKAVFANRQARVAVLLVRARENDDEVHDTIALAALETALAIDPANVEAKSLKAKVSQYGPRKKERLAREEAARNEAARQERIADLLDQAKRKDDPEQAVALLNQLLTIDSGNVQAVTLKQKLCDRLGPYTNSLGMKFVRIEAGEFNMGGEQKPDDVAKAFGGEVRWYTGEQERHRVRLTKSFRLSTYSVKRGQFAKFIAESGYQTEAEKHGSGWGMNQDGYREQPGFNWKNPGFNQDDNHPVVEVSWNDATAFCNWISKRKAETIACQLKQSGNTLAGLERNYFSMGQPNRRRQVLRELTG